MASRHRQIKYDMLARDYERLIERLSDLQSEQSLQCDPALRSALHQQITQLQPQCDALEQQLDALERELHGGSPAAALSPDPPVPAPAGTVQDIENQAGNQGAQGMFYGPVTFNYGPSAPAPEPPSSTAPAAPPEREPGSQRDWGEAPDVAAFYGRERERVTLAEWISNPRCRIICILGIGGMGKTSLATVMAQHCQESFAHLVWRSLRNAPQIDDLLAQWIGLLSHQQQTELPDTTSERITLLLEYLRRERCLLLLDNLETVLSGEQPAGAFRAGYEGYGELIRRLGEQQHQSLLLLTSREIPEPFERFESSVARTLSLNGVSRSESQLIVQDKGLRGDEAAWNRLVERYSGNPLALKVIAEYIREAYGGAIHEFLREDEPALIMGELRFVLDQQFERLSAFEQDLMYWLAIEREPVSTDSLRETLLKPQPRRTVVEAIVNLRRRSLIERSEAGLTLQNVVMEYVTERLIGEVSAEILDDHREIRLLNSHALMKAQAKEYVRNSQVRLILDEVLEKLEQQLSSRAAVIARLSDILAQLRAEAQQEAAQ